MNKQRILKSIPFRAARRVFWDNRIIRKITRNTSDKFFLPINYWWSRLEFLDLNNPETYTEKIQWLKANWRDMTATKAVDKYLVREYIKDILGDEYGNKILNELYGVYNDPEDIDLNTLPQSFVLKANHGSGWNIIVKDKNNIKWNKCLKKMRKWLKINYYYEGREYQYKNIQPKIICEKFLENNDGTEILDYKFMCFDGKPKTLWIDYDRHLGHKRNFYDLDGNPLGYTSDVPSDYKIPFVKPENYDEMLTIVNLLCKGFPHVRIDLYNVNGCIYFGEMTFSSCGGCVYYETPELNDKWGMYLNLKQ